jgi:sugar phosphate isomerase/epimerase
MYDNHLLSLAFLTVQGCEPREHIRIAAQTGYDAAGLRIIAPHGLELAHPIVGNQPLIREITTMGADLGIRFLDGEVFTLLPDTDVADWRPVLETAAELSMPLMQITCEDADFARAADNLGLVADMAAEMQIDMAIEFMRWRATATIEEATRLATASGRASVGILLDALHLSRSGGSPEAVKALPSGLVRYLQLCDAPAIQPASDAACIVEARGERMMPGEGALWLCELMEILPADLPISVETPHKGDQALSYLDRARLGMTATRRFLDSCRGAGHRA